MFHKKLSSFERSNVAAVVIFRVLPRLIVRAKIHNITACTAHLLAMRVSLLLLPCLVWAATNPFLEGCLHSKKLSWSKRVCNSEDKDEDGGSSCFRNSQPLAKAYPEIRVYSGNWESSMFLSWIAQIISSEVMMMPMTLVSKSVRVCPLCALCDGD